MDWALLLEEFVEVYNSFGDYPVSLALKILWETKLFWAFATLFVV